MINEHLPYERKSSIIPRIASFMGSTNMSEFLTDETGSVRWLCFEIKAINWEYEKEVDINKVWAQAYALYKEPNFNAEMSRDEIEKNEERNYKLQQFSIERELIPTYLKPATKDTPGAEFLSASQILIYMSGFTTIKFNRVMIGRAISHCGFKRVKGINDRYGYRCVRLK